MKYKLRPMIDTRKFCLSNQKHEYVKITKPMLKDRDEWPESFKTFVEYQGHHYSKEQEDRGLFIWLGPNRILTFIQQNHRPYIVQEGIYVVIDYSKNPLLIELYSETTFKTNFKLIK